MNDYYSIKSKFSGRETIHTESEMINIFHFHFKSEKETIKQIKHIKSGGSYVNGAVTIRYAERG